MPEMIAGAISGKVTVNSARSGADTGNLRRLLQARVHVAQRRGGEHVDVGRIVHAEHHDKPGHRVEIDAPVEAGPLSMVLMRPDFGDPRIDQATPATSGGTNRGTMLAAPMKPLHGVLVRTTIHENASPMPPPARCRRCRRSAS